MLTVIDKPIIQFAVEEAIASGITHLIFVIGRTKRSIADHFDSNPELDMLLRSKGQDEMADHLNSIIPSNVSCVYFRQAEALGLGHAVACAAPVIDEDEPFAVLLADDLMRAQSPVLKQMIDIFDNNGRSLVAVESVAEQMVQSYGIVDADLPHAGSVGAVRGVIEKPRPQDAPSNQAIVGRYILDGRIMGMLRKQKPGAGNEIQLTDALSGLIDELGLDAYRFHGRRYDCGSKMGFLECTMASAMEHPEFGPRARALMQSMIERKS
jgi:UTP--glucose-1-phosphate uridylyltransferase